MTQAGRDEDELAAVVDAMEELALAQGLLLANMPALARLRGIAAGPHRRRERLTKTTWLHLAAAFAECSDEAERMAG